eukprot:1176902-Prorocentrum_minimum.AAC.3
MAKDGKRRQLYDFHAPPPGLLSAHAKKPQWRAAQWKYGRPLLGVGFCTTARCTFTPHLHLGVCDGSGVARGAALCGNTNPRTGRTGLPWGVVGFGNRVGIFLVQG